MTRPTRFTRLDRENYETLFAYAASSESRRVRPESAHRHHAGEGQGIPRSRARRVTTAEAPVDRSAHESANAPSLARRSSTQRQERWSALVDMRGLATPLLWASGGIAAARGWSSNN